MRNPWASVDWGGQVVASMSHEHITPADAVDEGRFDIFYDVGYRHFAISNYYPSDPSSSYPLTNLGVTIPTDAIGCPNAEHHSPTNAIGHFCAPGSLLVTGDADSGMERTWQQFVDDVAANLLYADGGGITMNHPHGEYPGTVVAKQMLDYNDEIVLGIEIYNGFWRSIEDEAEFWKRWGLQAWHEILVSGRWCLGFGASDRGRDGRNMLLVPDLSGMTTAEKEHACLQAYREGHFFVATSKPWTDLAFTGFSADGSSIHVTTNNSTEISFGYARIGDSTYTLTEPVTGTEATYTLAGDEVYVWAQGMDSEYARIISQPVMYKTVDEVATELRRRRARRFIGLG